MTTSTTIGSNGTTVSQTLLDTMNGASSSSSTSSTSATGAQSASDLQNTFLTLLVTQLKNQDPTNPADSSQMTSQLAQINTVTGIGQLNTSLSSLATQLSAGQQTQAALLIGSNVLAAGNNMTVSSGKSSSFGVQLANDVSDLQIVVKNSSGQIVNTLDLGAQGAGVVPVTGWTPVDSKGATLADGTYTITAQGTINGQQATATTLSASQVQSVVQMSGGAPGLKLSNGSTVALSGVASIL
ncbi:MULTISPECIES: flagellar hook assembly protein FlgD [Caballeronia]|uniref:Basal-body rod modification protein FlgD n=1 Tax=Caballeronia zhejiangensis TaxID=871203 RepID=A0A656QAE9_9BURK|nr:MULTISPECIES: flagellar hook assembly protein FlgD [Caballeronia]EKS69269.1 flagellar basal body rod modification protein [Burkholderia sp. SJ98]KDR24787.1 flagellar basal body rod modification protein FlgD [Caballeronia zhejiangensis]MCG7405060.1 flagellar hook assembly protein FlgD [Caballeronia zhejiangensis]MCI1041601.1 flagellar hook assembly protein FlgD [Caballeronia zhejiangensis]MDR5763664.1 flagellar hook assembly protein FlgD [Caballeronia sp. LZ028]